MLNGTWLLAFAVLASFVGVYQATTGCKNCINLGKEEKAMFRAHSNACLSQSGVEPRLVDTLLHGELVDDPALKSHVYCVLLKCKVISKDGKLQKTAVLGKIANRADGKNATKALESCADQRGDTPEDLAWNLFRCGYEKKAVLFNYMPTSDAKAELENNNN
ncbi:B2 protein-like [Pectinophora gossypiella]|uniref:B2 protein-like n=1 Tax=Pectinophora gossypiella TaxID=13191 RepID=UPI00214F2A51|nr:B2 protein-like [Pectinophora gossypiella]